MHFGRLNLCRYDSQAIHFTKYDGPHEVRFVSDATKTNIERKERQRPIVKDLNQEISESMI